MLFTSRSTYSYPVTKYLKRYLKQHLYGLIALLCILLFGVYYLHQHSTDKGHTTYSLTQVKENTSGQHYTIDTFGSDGTQLSHREVTGLNITVSRIGNLSGGRKALTDTVTVKSSKGSIQVSGSTIVAYPTSWKNLYSEPAPGDTRTQLDRVLANIPKDRLYGSKVLMVKTYSEHPVFATYGRRVSSFYSNIDNTQVFKIDGKIIFVFRGEFSLSDAAIFAD